MYTLIATHALACPANSFHSRRETVTVYAYRDAGLENMVQQAEK
jgi:hypothetical protein